MTKFMPSRFGTRTRRRHIAGDFHRGNSRDIVKAVEAAVTRDMSIVALTGYDGGELAGLLGPQDVEIRIPSHRSARIQEMHMLTVNCLCDLIDNTLFPHQDD